MCDQTLNAKMNDEKNENFKHDTVFHEFRIVVAAGAATCEDGQRGDPERTTTIRKSVNITEYESDKINSKRPNSHNDFNGILQEMKNMTNPQLETGTSSLTCTKR